MVSIPSLKGLCHNFTPQGATWWLVPQRDLVVEGTAIGGEGVLMGGGVLMEGGVLSVLYGSTSH